MAAIQELGHIVFQYGVEMSRFVAVIITHMEQLVIDACI